MGAGSAQWEVSTNPLELSMPPRVLYQRLCQQLQVCAPALGVWPRRRLALLVTGLLLARHAALPRVAAQLRRVTARASRFDRAAVATDIGRYRVRGVAGVRARRPGQPAQAAGWPVPAVAGRYATNHALHLSTLALAYGGRALPLAWCRWSGKLHGSYWQQIDGLFDQAARLLPPQVRPVVVADRGIASPVLIQLVEQHGWDYLLRVTSDVTMRVPDQPRQVLHLGQLLERTGRTGGAA